jgi:FixJ family two-component response regulator
LPPVQQKIVTIVDNDPGVRKALVRLLSRLGYVAHAFDSAAAFFDTSAPFRSDCLIVDINLGNVSGIELARRISEDGLAPPIIFITARSDETVWRQCASLGCVACLRKPLVTAQLIDAVVQALGSTSSLTRD